MPEKTRAFYDFGPFRLDASQRLFERDGERIPLAPKVFDTLLALVESPGEVLEKGELLKKIWPDAFVEEGSLAQNVSILRKLLGESTNGQPYIQTVPKRGYLFVAHCFGGSRPESFRSPAGIKEAIPSIAVLPFANLSGDPDQEYFSDGLTEEIINALAQIPGLKVTARTSSFAFRSKEQDITKIAKALHVGTILEGSVRRSARSVRVTAQLINAADGYHLWGERYHKDLPDLFAVQEEIAAAIVEVLHIKLMGKPAKRYLADLRAYDLFLKGKHELSKLTSDAAASAKEALEQAITIDPHYSEPHAELGQYYFLVGASSLHPVEETMPAARAHAQKALELSVGNSRAHAVLCGVASLFDLDWREAERQYRLALATDPVPPEVRSRCALSYLLPLGRFQEAMFQFETALEQDPLSVASRGMFSWTLLCAGLYDRALAEADKCLQINENHWIPLSAATLALVLRGDLAEARRVAERGVRSAAKRASHLGLLAGILARSGEIRSSEEVLAQLMGMAPSGLFFYHLLCSEIEAAADEYAKMIEERDAAAIWFAAAGFLRPLRSSCRWPALSQMMNLPTENLYS
jgi:TolB-like protein/Tfp pilus assembly protein PilF